jgi:hypothetical protein
MITLARKPVAAQSIESLRLLIDGRSTVVVAANDATGLVSLNGHRCAVMGREDDRLIELSTVAPTEEELEAAAMGRVLEAAAGPKVPRSARPSTQVAAARTAARQYHAAVWGHGYNEGQAHWDAKPLRQRVTEADVPALVELAIGAVLADPALRAQLREALDAAEMEAVLV